MKPIEVLEVVDSVRGCGWRKPGGIYLRCDAPGMACGKLPIPVVSCPCCGTGVKPARGWTWFEPGPFVDPIPCSSEGPACSLCVCSNPPKRAGLLWIGEKFYPKPSDWLEEANKLGVSRRISRVPNDFKVGETWVFAAHRKGLVTDAQPPDKDCIVCQGSGRLVDGCACECALHYDPAIFHVFRPTRIEYVTKGNETQEELEALVKRGLTPVKVRREGDLGLEDKAE